MKMSKSVKNILAGGLALIGVYLVYTYYKKGKTNEQPNASNENEVSGISKDDKYPLKKGSKGANVKEIQRLILGINKSLLPKFGADSDFGSETESAVSKLLGKKIVEQSDYSVLLNMYNKVKFPLVSSPQQNSDSFSNDPFKIK